MSGLVQAYKATAPRSKESGYVAVLYAAVTTAMVAAQLFTFDDFIILIGDMFTLQSGMVFAASIVIIEVFALPSLLRMSLSKAFRYLSLILSALVAVTWIFITLWGAITKPVVESSGLFGTLDPLGPGYWAVCFSVAFAALAIWSIWGLWPVTRKK